MENDKDPAEASGRPPPTASAHQSDVPASAHAFTVIPGDGPAPAAHLVRHPDGFVCLNLSYPEPSRAVLRLVDSSCNTESVASEVNVTDVIVTDELGGDFRF